MDAEADVFIEEEETEEGVPPVAMEHVIEKPKALVLVSPGPSEDGGDAAHVEEDGAIEGEAGAGAAPKEKPSRVSVYENQRKNVMGSGGFTAKNLYGYERSAWSDEEGLPSSKDDPLLVPGPEGKCFAPGSTWAVALCDTGPPRGAPRRTDEEGWQYGGVKWPLKPDEWLNAENGRSTLVRRRRWQRRVVPAGGDGGGGAQGEMSSMRATQAQEQLLTTVVEAGEKVLGKCEAGLLAGGGDTPADGIVVLTDNRLIWTADLGEEEDGAGEGGAADALASAVPEPEPEPALEPEPAPAAAPSDRSRVVIEVIQAWGLPTTSSWASPDKYAGAPKLDPYASLKLIDWHDEPRDRGMGRTQARSGCNEPVWRNYIELGTSRKEALVQIEIYDEVSIMADTKIAMGQVKLKDLPPGEARMMTLQPFDPAATAAAQEKTSLLCKIMDGAGTPWPGGLDPRRSESAPGRGKFIPIIQLRRLDPDITPVNCRMTMFLVRHGESEWNEAKANHRFDVMAGGYDHPLNSKGMRQALGVHHAWASAARSSAGSAAMAAALSTGGGEDDASAGASAASLAEISLRDSVAKPVDAQAAAEQQAADQIPKSDAETARVQQIIEASRMYASPLTRAVQTAMLAFEGHPCLGERELGMTLLCSAREVKNLGGFDTVGDALGDDIPKRAMEKLSDHLTGSPAWREQLANLDAVKMDLDEVQSKWWTSVMDTNETLERRVQELLCRVRYDAQMRRTDGAGEGDDAGESDGDMPQLQTAIVVAHSIIIKEMIKRCTQQGSAFGETELAAQLGAGKINNGGVVALDLQFLDNFRSESQRQPARIEAAQMLFGTEVLRHGVVGAQAIHHSAIPLHSLVRMEEGWSGLMSSFSLKLKFRATPDGIGTEDGGHVQLEFVNRSERDKLMHQLKTVCETVQEQLLTASLGVDESEILREPCASFRPLKGAVGPELVGVRGGEGGYVMVTMKRLIWIPPPERAEEALPMGAAGALAVTGDQGALAAVLGLKLKSVSFIELLAERSMSNPMGFSSPGLKVKLRGGGAEHVVVLFATVEVRDAVKAALDEQMQEMQRKNPAAAGDGTVTREGYLQKNNPNGMLWQQRWFELKKTTLVYYDGSVEDKPERRPKGEIDLRDVRAVQMTNRDGGWHNETEFGIRLVDRVGRAPYELRAKDPAEAEQWIRDIQKAARALGAVTDSDFGADEDGDDARSPSGTMLAPTFSELKADIGSPVTTRPSSGGGGESGSAGAGSESFLMVDAMEDDVEDEPAEGVPPVGEAADADDDGV